MNRRTRPSRMFRNATLRRLKAATLALAAMPLFQNLFCYPDFPGAFTFELQSLIVNTLVNAFSIVVANVLRI